MKQLFTFLIAACLFTPFFGLSQVANDVCSSAIPLYVNPTENCDSVTSATLVGAGYSNTMSNFGCSGGSQMLYNDVWFSFTATNPSHKVSIVPETESPLDYYHIIYEGSSCGGLSLLSCHENNESILSNLTVGQTYKIRMFSKTPVDTNLISFFNICVSFNQGGPVNDECINALSLPVNSDTSCVFYEYGSFNMATSSSQSSYCSWPTFYEDDIWYKFVATGTKHTVQLHNIQGNDTLFQLGSLTGPCSNLVGNICSQGNELIMDNLTIGQNYYIRVLIRNITQAYTTTFNICVTTPVAPSNDECSNAIQLGVNSENSCLIHLDQNLFGATLSPEPSSCINSAFGDAWYTFVASQTSHIISIRDGYKYDLYSGDCGNLNLISCQTALSLTFPGLVIGETYYIRLFATTNSFNSSICVKTELNPPVNDECDGALDIPVSETTTCVSEVDVDFTHATKSPSGANDIRDLWYKFTATSFMHYLVLSDMSPNNLNGLWVLSYKNCDQSFDFIANFGNDTLILDNLVPDSTYYLRLHSTIDDFEILNNQTLTICITSPDPPQNDDCENSILIPVSPGITCSSNVSGTMNFANVSPYSLTCSQNNKVDVWYHFTASSTSHRILTTSTLPLYTNVFLGSCDSLTLIASSCNSSAPVFQNPVWTIHSQVTGLSIGQSYFIQVYYSDPVYSNGDFTICITTPPSNDECVNATILPVSDTSVCLPSTSGTLFSATRSAQTLNCTSGSYTDVWYQFTAGNPVQQVSLYNVTSGLGLSFAVYNNNCTTPGIPVHCEQSASAITQVNNLVPGNTYLLRIFSNSYFTNSNSFNVCISTPDISLNDECNTAIELSINRDYNCDTLTHGSFSFSTQSSQAMVGCYIQGSADYGDIWYKFTANNSNILLNLLNVTGITNTDIQLKIYAGNCSSLGQLAQYTNYCSGTQWYLQGLMPGTTYYLRIIAKVNTTFASSSFDICLKNVIVPPNDLCQNAIDIPVNPNYSCALTVSGDLQYTVADPNPPSSCISWTDRYDVWYKFTATSIKHRIAISNGLDFAVYRGDCNSLTRILCATGPYTSSNNFTVGETYYVRVFDDYNLNPVPFTLCISTDQPPVNDNCENAIILPSNTDSNCGQYGYGTLFHASPSIQSNDCSNSNDDDDVWYKFVATHPGHWLKLTNNNPGAQLYFSVYSGDCSTFSTLLCHDSLNAVITNLTVGNTYYVRVYTAGTTPSNTEINTFRLCLGVYIPQPDCNYSIPAGNTCSEALGVCSLNGYCGTTSASYTADSWPEFDSTFCGTIENNSFLYFYPDSSEFNFNVWVTSSLTGLGIQIFVFSADDCQGPISNHLCWDPHNVPIGHTALTASGLTPGEKYYMMIDGQSGDVCDYIFATDHVSGSPVTVSWNKPYLCLGDSVLASASGGNGTYSWDSPEILNQVSGNQVWLHPSTPGLAEVSLRSFENGFCPDSTLYTYTIEVKECICPILATHNSDSCINSTDFDLFSSDLLGGTFSWSGPNNFVSNERSPMNVPSPGAPGSYDYIVTATGINESCSDTVTVVINTPVNASFTYGNSIFCTNDEDIVPEMAGSTGGVFSSSPGLSMESTSGILHPQTSSVGSYSVSFTTSGFCPQASSQTVSIAMPPAISFSGLTSLCQELGSVSLDYANPQGGTYSGSGVSGGLFDPLVAEIGTHTLTYSYTDPLTGCTEQEDFQLTVDDCIGIEENKALTGISILPNPTQGTIVIKTGSLFDLKLFDAKGKLVLSRESVNEQITLNLENYSDGVYYVHISNDTYLHTEKIILTTAF